MTTHALVVGAGVAGPVTAVGLRRLGWRVTLCERRPEPALAEGAFLGVAPNGLRALEVLGLAERVAERGFPCSAFRFHGSAGQVLAELDRRRDRERFGWPLTMIRRGELHEVLLAAALDAGAELHLGRSVAAVEGDLVRFDDGSTVEADLVVGCDGLHSRVRQAVLPSAPPPVFSGLWDYGGFARLDDPAPLCEGVNEMVFGRRAFFGAFLAPTGEVWWFHNGPEQLAAGEILDGLGRLHAHDPPWIGRVLDATRRPLGPWGLYDVAGLRSWSRGRVCVLGDAAHAMSPSAGQGASLAIEDALALTLALRDHADLAAAFDAYERFRRPRVEVVARIARRNGSGKAPGPVGRWLRDRLLPLFLRLGQRVQDEGYAYHFGWETRL